MPFIGRDFEQERIREAESSGEASILIVYGRRRIGKTELIEHTLKNRNLVKLEGVEDGNKAAQMERVLYQLSKVLNDSHISRMQFNTWLELLDFIADKLQEGTWTLYFEELQWLAQYKNEFISDLKYVWDNRLRHNSKLLVVLCGSSPSFMINQVVNSKALYNRSSYEIYLQEFSLTETKEYLSKRSFRELMDAYLTVGGIPEYLKRLKKYSSIRIGLCELSFKQQGYLSKEHERIFISSFSDNIHYREIIDFLSQVKFATRSDIEKHLGVGGGGKLSDVLKDLTLCGFIEKYSPYNTGVNSKLNRYCVSDNYLRFYFKYIKPIQEEIEQGDYNADPMRALNNESYQKWLGYSFERFCRKHHRLIAKIIGFSAVRYKSGVYFDRKSELKQKGFQIDLIFDRADNVLTICEIKYLQNAVGTEVISEFEQKLNTMPNRNNKTIEKVLITAQGATDGLRNRAYFDYIITLDDLITNS